MSQRSVKRKVGAAGRQAKKVTRHPAYKYLARGGFVVRGFLYGYMGVVALRAAVTGGARQADQQDTLVAVAGFPLGRVLLLAVIAFLAAYALWGFIRAIYDPLRRGDDAKGIAIRLGFAWSGLVYTALTFFAIGLFTHGASGHHADDTQQAAARLLSAPAGVLLTEAAGLIAIAAGLSQVYDAYKATFRSDLKRGEMSRGEKQATDAVGRLGLFSRAAVFSLMGWFIFLAAFQHDAHKAKGVSGTFAYLLTQPFGRILLALVALGFIALGAHSLAMARYIRLPGDRE
jgi:hypothetical protein